MFRRTLSRPLSTSSESVALSWSESSTGSIDYNIERSTTSGSGYSTLISGLTTSSYTDTSVSGDTPYYYKVDAYFSGSTVDSNWSSNSNRSYYDPRRSNRAGRQPRHQFQCPNMGQQHQRIELYHSAFHRQQWWLEQPNHRRQRHCHQLYRRNACLRRDLLLSNNRRRQNSTNGGSAYDGLPSDCGVATVYGYEGFNYATASTWNGAGTTGVGFSGNWTIANSSHASIVSGLTYTTGSSVLTASGNALKVVTSRHGDRNPQPKRQDLRLHPLGWFRI